MKKSKQILVVISGPTGVGKSTILRALLKKRRALMTIPSTTTRPSEARKGGDTNRIFVSPEEFTRMKRVGIFLETARIRGYQYGTSWKAIDKVFAQKKTPLLDINSEGHRDLRKMGVWKVCSLFLMPEKADVLRDRILERHPLISTRSLESRLAEARREMKRKGAYDRVIVNRTGQMKEAIAEALAFIDKCAGVR
jgi:guanylate kinase